MEEAGIFQLRSDYERETMMADEDKVFQKRIQLLFEHDRVIRSHAIYEASAIERMIESVIAWHFCPDEEQHLSFTSLMFVSTEVMLRKKIDILEQLLENYYPDILKDLPNIINDLHSVRRFRNKFAHDELILDEEKVKKDGIWLRSVNRKGKVVEELYPQKKRTRESKRCKQLNGMSSICLLKFRTGYKEKTITNFGSWSI